nr:hypothetical protein [Bacteroidales bacterium]
MLHKLTLFICFIILFPILNSKITAQKLTSSNLPIISIYTFGNEIPNEPKINALMGIIYNGK